MSSYLEQKLLYRGTYMKCNLCNLCNYVSSLASDSFPESRFVIMGGAVSAGADNDELIDNLLEADYIKTGAVERVFRAVDRGHYFTVECKERAYRDIAWKCGNLHISAPCIYSKVMENLKLAPGMSFLNLGSGTGYLSTMAGLILGPYGINHGIEIHEDVLDYARRKLEEFITSSSAIDEYEFCEPKLVCGNCLHLGNCARQYDRVYCSAACPENHESYMKNLIKVGGILVIPINDQLMQICRTSDTSWESKSVLPVSFATLISGKSPDVSEPLKMPDTDPLSLQDICRIVVRSILRRNVDIEHPELKKPPRVPRKKVKKRTIGQLVMPIFHSNSDDEEDIVSFQAGRSIIGWSQVLSRYPAPQGGTMIARCGALDSSQTGSLSQTRQDNAMEEDSNFVESGSSSDNIFDEMSESDFEELQNMLAMSETSTSTVTSGSDSESGKQKLQAEAKGSMIKLKNKNKKIQGKINKNKEMQGKINKNKEMQGKIDSGIVEDFEIDGEATSDSERDEHEDKMLEDQYPFLKVTDSDTDTESCETTLQEKVENKKSLSPVSNLIAPGESLFSGYSSSSVESSLNSGTPSTNTVTYTTCMKEKIKLLPLPMTLKYFLNLNREL